MGVVAAVQIAPKFGDSMATANLAAGAIAEAGGGGAWRAVLPESYIPGPPDYADRFVAGSAAFDAHDKLFFESAINVPGPETDVVGAACREHGVMAAVGVTERPARSGTLYNTLLWFATDGTIIGRHRKIVPTDTERIVWGSGDGTTLRTLTTEHGIVGGLICWENYMPLARTALYAGGEQIHVAPTMAGGGAAWIAAMRHIANEGRMWVVSTGNFLRADDLPDDLRTIGEYDEGQILNPGGSLIVDPGGALVAGPLLDDAGILYADCDPDVALISRRMFDAVGHYSRGDLFTLHVAGTSFAIPIGDDDPAAALDDHVWRVEPR